MYEDVSETLELITSWNAIQPVREKDPRADLLQDSQVDSKAATNDAYIAASPSVMHLKRPNCGQGGPSRRVAKISRL
jgi:hypothetical protein